MEEKDNTSLEEEQPVKKQKSSKLSATYTAYKSFTTKPPFSIAFAAPTSSGKTYLINKLIEHVWRDTFDNIVIASPTLEFEDEYPIEDKVSKNTNVVKIQSNLKPQLDKVILEQKNLMAKHKDDPTQNPEVHTLIIMDDCIDTNLFRGNRVDNIADVCATRGRHYNLSVCIVSQVLSRISSEVRRNLKNLFIFAPLNYMDIERVLDEYVPHAWRALFRAAQQELFREQYAFILIDGNPENRQNFKQRIRKGFKELMFPLEADEKTLKLKYLNKK
jgi:hypothetical protein